MTETANRFCPRCGTSLIADMAFCPRCGFDAASAGRTDESTPTAPPAPPPSPAPPTATAADSGTAVAVRRGPAPSAGHQQGGGSLRRTIVVAAVLIAVGLLGFGLLTRPGPAGSTPQPAGGQGGGGGTPVASAPIVGLTILSPTDGQAVASKDILVIGLAPPGVSVTQDVSFGLDQHSTADGTGHWAIKVGLQDGDNKLVFRIGDDQSTKREVRVTYTPQKP
jgi:ribosomal protein S27AE